MKKYLFLTVILAALLSASCGSENGKQKPRVVRVGVHIVGGAQGGALHEYVGSVEEASSVDLCFEQGGKVTRVYVRDGQRVAAGQLLAETDSRSASNTYQAALASLEQARDAYNRAKMVYDQGSLPEVRWVEVQTKLNQAQSLCDIAKKNLEDCQLRAPCSGTVCDRNIEAGSSATPMVPVMRILNLTGLYVKLSIPETDINNVHPGDTATVSVGALDGRKIKAVVSERNINADPLSHSYIVRLKLKGDTKDLLPGMVCRVDMGRPAGVTGLEIPNRAVQLTNDGQRFVWLVQDGKAVMRHVSIGDLTTSGVIITDGLSQGDSVITDGTLKVSNGTAVCF